MSWTAKYRKQRMCALTAAIVATAWMPVAMAAEVPVPDKDALPTNQNIKSGDIVITTKPYDTTNDKAKMNIALSGNKGIIEWDKFNIGSKAEVNFTGPQGGWAVLNRVTGGSASAIYGALNGQGGTVFLINPHGITFGEGASVDVGSLVASTLQISDSDFLNDAVYNFSNTKDAAGNKIANIDGKIEIKQGADVTAEDGYVALLAYNIDNAGTITAPDVAMAAGQQIELSYDKKINLRVDVSKDNPAIIETKNNYILMRGSEAQKLVEQSLINNTGTIQAADKIVVTNVDGKQQVELSNSGGNIAMVAADMVLNGTTSAKKGGTITTTGYETMQVRDGAKVQAEAGTWNINAKNVSVTANPDNKNDKSSPNRVSNTALSNTLADTNVNIVASPDREDYYSDIAIKEKINKDGAAATSLTLTAGRNSSVDADITSTGGALNITLNSSKQEKTNSKREDGASIIRADINTNGGNFTTNGTHGTYFGLKRDGDKKDAVGTARSVITNGGNITLNGDEVLVATGGNVVLNAGSGNVFVAGDVNSANAYYDDGDGKTPISWIAASNAAKGEKTHLAVITSALEDAVATSTIATDYTTNSQAYVGGHVVKVKTDGTGALLDEKGQPLKFTVQDNGEIVLSGTPVVADDYLNIDDTGLVETFGTTDYKGWYKITNANNAEDVRYVRFFAWTEGDEAGKVFFVQTTGETVLNNDMDNSTDSDWLKAHGFAINTGMNDEVYYTNFAPKEPNDDKGHDTTNGSEMALTVNYDTHNGGNDVLYSQWNDTSDVKDNVKHYVVEEELGKTSLQVEAHDVTMKGKIGNVTHLKSVDVNASGNVIFNGLVNVDNTISVKGNNITIKDKLTADVKNVDNAIDLRAQNNFINEVADSAKALKVGEGSHWKVYSNTPFADTLGDLNSNNFAEWGWDGTSATAVTGDRFIFKYNPTLAFTANNASKKYGETLSDTGYTFTNSLSGLYTQNFYDGDDAKLREHYGLNNVGTQSAGYPASAAVGSYRIDLTNTETTATQHGYNVVLKPGTLTVTSDNPGEVKPQLDPHEITNVTGSASYTEAARNDGPGVDRVLGLQSAELPFFREENGQTKLYGTYDVSVDPDKVKMEPTAKVLPEPDQPKNQYREYDKAITTKVGTAKFKLTYNGSTFDIYPVDIFGKKVLKAGDAAKNVEVESQALFAAFKEMGITLDDLDGVYTHFDNKKEVQFFRK